MATKFACLPSGDRIAFECEDTWNEDLIYSSACHAVARHVVEISKLLDEVLEYLELSSGEKEDLKSSPKYEQAEEIGEYLYDEQNWVTVE